MKCFKGSSTRSDNVTVTVTHLQLSAWSQSVRMPPTRHLQSPAQSKKKRNYSTAPYLHTAPPTPQPDQLCIYCGQKTASLKNHYAHNFTCGKKANLDHTAEFELSRILSSSETANEIQCPDELNALPQRSAAHSPGFKNFGSLGGRPVNSQGFHTAPLDEDSFEYPPTGGQSDDPTGGVVYSETPDALHEPKKNYHIPEPHQYQPLGRVKVPPIFRAGAPVSPEKSGTVYADRCEGFKQKGQDMIYGPFTESDWNFTRWAKRHQLTHTAIDDFLKMPGVSAV